MKKPKKKSRMRLKPPTMYDVAKLAGVSQPTVSRVLNNSETAVQISAETKQRVLDAIEELGYRPNILARRLRTQRTQTVALLIADLSNAFYHPLARAIQDVAHQHDYEVLISNSDHLYEKEKHFCEIVLGRAVDGVIMVPIRLSGEELDHYVSQTHIPFVVLGQHVDHPNIDVVYLDDERATYEATRWLISECGHTSIGYIGVPDFFPPGPRRLRGFRRAMDEAGLTFDPCCMQRGDFTLESGMSAAHTLMQTGKLPSALMVVNDLMAIGVILALQEAGYSVPRDVAVIGFDNIPEAIIVRPTLTTIAQDSRDIGQKLATALFERIENPNIVTRRIFESPYRLIPRQSTRAPGG
ncbi:MAG: LacI family DNA-binding transcriptional regulator [Anaerolineae bacterium]|nr:LacI family DNA-binding transcriptional regulator [Anaerolineae bacterium]